jgi:AraC-like DNA-binding protein
MNVNFNANIKFLTGGSYCGGEEWNKPANELDKCFKIYYIRRGEVQILDNNNNFSLKAENLYFINGYAICKQRCIKKFDVDWIHFHPESVYFDYLLKHTPCVTELNLNNFKSFFNLFRQIGHYFSGQITEFDQCHTKIELQSFTMYVIAKVFEKPNNKILFDNQDFLRLLPALELILYQYHTTISLKDIATSCCLSPNYFHRLFLKTFGITPFSHLQKTRMEESVRQLAYTSKTVKEIAYSVGYEDEAYFSRTFSKYYKISPGRYRNNILRKQIP